MNHGKDSFLVIEPARGWRFLNVKELINYSDLLRFLIWRDIKVEYAQTILGFTWAIIQPLIQIILFTIIFGQIAKINTGEIPYALFAAVGLIPWNYISQAMVQSCSSLISNQYILAKIYFPRIIYPLVPITSRFIDFGISLVLLIILMIYYGVAITWSILYLPVFVLVMVLFSAGSGIWLSAMAVRFRDVKVGTPFIIRLLMYTAPIVYPISSIPEKYQGIYSLNPIVSVIEGFRASLLGTPMEFSIVTPGIVITLLIAISGVYYFNRVEHIFVDVV